MLRGLALVAMLLTAAVFPPPLFASGHHSKSAAVMQARQISVVALAATSACGSDAADSYMDAMQGQANNASDKGEYLAAARAFAQLAQAHERTATCEDRIASVSHTQQTLREDDLLLAAVYYKDGAQQAALAGDHREYCRMMKQGRLDLTLSNDRDPRDWKDFLHVHC